MRRRPCRIIDGSSLSRTGSSVCVGRKSRSKAELREGLRPPTAKEKRRAALKADRRGSRVEPTVDDFTRVSALGESRLIEALIARHTTRMLNIDQIPDWYALEILKPLLPVVILDKAHVQLGVPLQRFPASFHGTGPAHLAWGLESTISACRLLLAGQIVGAAVIARQQLERWTLLLADVVSTTRGRGESVQEFIARCWSTYSMDMLEKRSVDTEHLTEATQFDDAEVTTDEPEIEHEHIQLSDGTEVCPPTVYGYLSEIIHGDVCRGGIVWEALQCLQLTSLPDDVGMALGAICDALSLCTIQLKLATAALLVSRGHSAASEHLLGAGDRVEPLDVSKKSSENDRRRAARPMTRPALPAYMPLNVNEGLETEPRQYLASRAALYERVIAGDRPAGRLYRDDELVTLAFTAHRHASAVIAVSMLEREKDYYGERFEPQTLVGRGITFVLAAEIAGLCARWSQQSPNLCAAAAVISSSIRSAYWLWLEDDDRAMATLRCTLEQTARLRTWHLKPAKAATLEANIATTPRDWLEGAGWRRLSALNRALSEFAHAHRGTRWDGARQLLTALQTDPDESIAPFTARGAAMDFVTTLAARETIRIIGDLHSKVIADAMREAMKLGKLEMSADDHALESVFDHVWQHRDYSLGPPQFA